MHSIVYAKMAERLRPQEFAQALGVTVPTLRRWERDGRIQSTRTIGNHRRFSYPSPLISSLDARKRYIYCRVSSPKQKDDLERQKQSLLQAYPDHEIISDVGSGLNFRRKGLLRMVDFIMQGGVEQIVVSHRDRLCRFAFELFEWICQKHDTILLVHHHEIRSAEQELSEDLLAIVHVFSCRHHGMRRYRQRVVSKNSTEADIRSSKSISGVDDCGQTDIQSGASSRKRQKGEARPEIEEACRHGEERGQREAPENEEDTS